MDQKELLHFPKRALFVVNPIAGRKTIQKYLSDCIRALMDAGYLVTTMVTSARGEVAQYARVYGKFYDLVVCAGGDGTLNETVTGLVDGGRPVPVGYVPCGTTNDFCASRGLPRDIPGAIEHVASGTRRIYDIGCFEDQYFTNVALFGAFSWMAYTTDQERKNRLGYGAYVLDGMRDLSRLKPIHMKLTADGETLEDDYLLGAVSNAKSLGGFLDLSGQGVELADGLLELVLVKAPHSLTDLDQLVRCVVANDFSAPWLTLRHAREITVCNPPELQWSLDGEQSGFYESAHIRVLPRFLELQGGEPRGKTGKES